MIKPQKMMNKAGGKEIFKTLFSGLDGRIKTVRDLLAAEEFLSFLGRIPTVIPPSKIPDTANRGLDLHRESE